MENKGYSEGPPERVQPGLLGVGQPASGGHTYVYEPDKSLRRLTMEALPSAENYRKLSKIGKDQRPTIDELMMGRKPIIEEEEGGEVGEDKVAQKGKVVKFGWIEGVFMRCLLNIWGVMLFLRLSWVIGQAGFIQGLVIITLCNVVTGITALSMSAVATNGQIASGGVYYMISRALGPEFGGAIGIMFTVANSISVATYTIGFCDNVFDLLADVVPGWDGIVDHNCFKSDCRINDLRILGSPVLILILLLAIVGMDWVTRVQKFLLVLLILAQIDMFVGSFIGGANAYVDENTRYSRGFTGWSTETLDLNVNANYGEGIDFFGVFGVFFTAVTGIVAGANLSGDLKDPSMAIPKGTLLAIIFTYITYAFYGVLVAFTFLPSSSGINEEYANSTAVPRFDDCSTEALAVRPCDFGSKIDQKVMIYISYTGYLVYCGCYGATLSSAIASLVGAPRVLQAVGRDKIYPKLEFFAKGNGANNDPLRGYILVFFIAFGCLMIGDLNAIGKLASNFFLAAYALMNLSVFHSSMTNSPGWRPSFKYYNKWMSLIGSIACLALMFLIEWTLAIGTIACISLLYGFMVYLKPEANWGSSAEALIFVNALNNVYSLNEQQEHVKNYRPKILVLSGNPAHRQPLVDFGNLITKKLSLMICAHITPKDQISDKDGLKENVDNWLKDHGIKSFYNVVENESFSGGVKNCLSLTGLGKLCPNMVLLGFKDEKSDMKSLEEYHDAIIASLESRMAVGILRVKGGLDFSSHVASEETITEETDKSAARKVSVYRGTNGSPLSPLVVSKIQQFQEKKRSGFLDVYWLYDDGGLTLLLPYILQTRRQFAECKMRVFSLANKPDAMDQDTRNLASLLTKFRIDFSEIIIIPDITKKAGQEIKSEFDRVLESYPDGAIDPNDLAQNAEKTNRHLRVAEIVREYSRASELVVLSLPMPKKGQSSPALYMAWLDIMTKDLPPTLLARGNQTSVLTFIS